jgi:hypothetical protein
VNNSAIIGDNSKTSAKQYEKKAKKTIRVISDAFPNSKSFVRNFLKQTLEIKPINNPEITDKINNLKN